MHKCDKRRKPRFKAFKQKCERTKSINTLPKAFKPKCERTKSIINPYPYEGQLHKTLKPDLQITRNPYLNYFRQFYAKKKGSVVEAAIQAGANWREMSAEQKAPYIKAAKNAPYVVATRCKRLMRFAKRKNELHNVQKLVHKWTKYVYKFVVKTGLKIK